MMDTTDVSRIVRDLILRSRFPCELVLVENGGQVWRITVKDEQACLVSFDVATCLRPAHIRTAVQQHFESQW